MLFCPMNYFGKWYIFVLTFSATFVSKGQNGSLIPDVYDQFFQNYYLINPANTDTSEIIINMGHKSQIGVFRGVRQTYFDANFRIKSKSPNTRHYIGLQLFNNSEGDFFSKNRAYGRYSFDLHISESYYLSAGLSLGAVSYAFKATQSSAGGSDLNYDGNIGLWLVGRNLKVGTSMQQVFQRTLTPIGQTFELSRQYNLNACYMFFINPYTQLTTHVWYKHQQNNSDDIQIAALITLQNLVEFGGNYRYRKGVVLIGGLKDIRIGTSRIAIAMSYSTGVLNSLAKGDNAVELFIKYSK
jgi:type IX secretion system PorP/SprF family membrane protein